MIKKIAVRASVLTAVFIAAVILFSYLTNRGNTDMSADMGGAMLPRISFTTEGYEVNSLPGYKSDMAITTMRDTLTPVANLTLEMNLNKYDAEVEKFTWQVFTLNGEECLQQETVKNVGEKQVLKFGTNGVLKEERVLKITLHMEGQDVYYYTRVKDSTDCSVKTCLDFAKNFHESAVEKEQTDVLETYLETNAGSGSSSFQDVNIYSSLEQVTWGGLQPDVIGDIQWEVKECNEAYTSIQLSYRVQCAGVTESPGMEYTVKEFFRVRIMGDKQYLMDYDRKMTQVFDGETGALNQKGILLGIAPEDLEYKNNEDGTIVSFVQNNELWNYDKEADEMSLVFSFAAAENMDIRNRYDRHEIHIVSVGKSGDTTFTVSGYMNRGIHEGQVGVAVYFFDGEKNSVTERAFVPTNKGYYVMQEELGKFVYYSDQNEKLYVMMDGTLYLVDLEEDTRDVLVRGLEEGQYQASEDGHLLAYQNMGGKVNESQKITVLNLQNGKSFELISEGDEYLKPIGFIKNDFAYGTMRSGDVGSTIVGQTVYPMYKIDIVNQKKETVKSYEVPGVYILDGYIDENMLTLYRASKNGEIYTAIASDYITNNEEKEESNIMLESYREEVRQTVMRLTFEDGIQDSNAKILKPKQVLFDKPVNIRFDEADVTGKYYVYALGDLQGVFDKAGYAVKYADEIEGTAVTSRQEYIWESGNRENIYEVDGMEPFGVAEGESTTAACLKQMLRKEGKEADVSQELSDGNSPVDILSAHVGGEGLDLTGCSIEEIFYTISRETPVMAMIGTDHAVLLIGYNKTNVAYLDPADGQRHSVTIEELKNMLAGCGNTFVGYTK